MGALRWDPTGLEGESESSKGERARKVSRSRVVKGLVLREFEFHLEFHPGKSL